MSLKDKVVNTLQKAGIINQTVLVNKKGIGPLIDDGKIYRSLRSYMAASDDMEVQDPYKKSVWVFAAINAISQNISSSAPFRIYTKVGNDKNYLKTGPLYDLFENPNDLMTRITLIQATIIYLELYGESFWVLDGRNNVTEMPKQIFCLNPDRFTQVIDKDGLFRGYWEYSNGMIKKEFAPWQILHFKYFNPYSDIRGLSPLEASRIGVEQDYFASMYNKNFFKDGAKVGGAIEVEDGLSDEQFVRLRTQFEDRHKGYQNSHKVAIIEGGKWKPDPATQKDMEFISLKDVTRGEVLAAFKTNEVVLGLYKNIQCFVPGTQLLTDLGYVNIEDITVANKVASMNPETGLIEFKEVAEAYSYDYEGTVYTQKKSNDRNRQATSSKIDYMVTPEHKMFGKQRKNERVSKIYESDSYQFKRISDIHDEKFCSPRNGIWDIGDKPETYDIGKRNYEQKEYKNGSKQGYKDTEFPIVTWLKFLGWFISEGCYKSDLTFELNITQVKEEGRRQIREDLKDFPYGIREHGKEFTFSGKDLYNYLLDNVGRYCHEKRIPRDILNLHPTLLVHLFEALINGDGTKTGEKSFRYMTTSRGLADDVYELALKLGYVPRLLGDEITGKKLPEKGRYPNARPLWWVEIPSRDSADCMVVVKPVPVQYSGKVYCVNVPPYHTLIQRYKGKSLIIGNSYEGIRQSHRSFWEETLIPKIKMITETLQSKFFSKLAGQRVYCEFDLTGVQALRADYTEKTEIAEKLFKMGFPINQISKIVELGFDEVPWGDTWFVPMNTVDIDAVINEKTPAFQVQEPDDKEDDDKQEDKKDDKKEDKTSHLDLSNVEDVIWARYINRQTSIEVLMKSKLNRFLFEQRKTVLKNINSDPPTIFDVEKEVEHCKKVLLPLYQLSTTLGNELLMEELSLSELPDNPEVDKFINIQVNKAANLIVNRLKTQLVDVLTQSRNNSYTIEQIANSIRDLYNKAINKIGTTSRTEVCVTINGVRFLQMKSLGITSIRWISKTEKGRETHSKLNGKVVKLGSSFSSEFTLRYPCDTLAPASEVVNCLCYAVPTKG